MTVSARTILISTVILAAIGFADRAGAMVFKSDTVTAQWDTWCYHHDGTYYLYYLVTEKTGEGFCVASSKDGVHWKDHGWAIRTSNRNPYYLGTGSVWKSPDFDKTGRFICNYSEHRKDPSGKRTQNILFAWSKDLIHWTKFGDEKMFKVDTAHYKEHGRWDCIYTIPRKEGGYWGTWTATGATRKGTVGIGYSKDGLHWKALPPPVVAPGVYESGAFHRFGDRVYAMFGARGNMWAYSADKVTGPYKRCETNPHLLARGHTYFSRFFPIPGAVLVNHHSMTGESKRGRLIGVDTYAAPLKLAEVDKAGVLRLKYWKGNDSLKGKPLKTRAVLSTISVEEAVDVDFGRGLIAEGGLIVPQGPKGDFSHVTIRADKKNYAIRLHSDGSVDMGTTDADGANWKKKHGANRRLKFGEVVSMRLLVRRGMLELYLDDHLMECWTMGCHRARTAAIKIAGGDVKMWEMTLEGWDEKKTPSEPVTKVATSKPLVALTFDDGPHAVNTPKLLALFKKHNAKATFFVSGSSVKRHPKLAARMLAEGHELGNHTTRHYDLAKKDAATVRKEIESTQAAVLEATGKAPVVFRAPFLSHSPDVWKVLGELKMPAINASRYTDDWKGTITAKEILEKATAKTGPGDIVIMHSWQNKTVQAMEDIIKRLQARGCKLVTVSQLLAASESE